jgi:hypothetical protein
MASEKEVQELAARYKEIRERELAAYRRFASEALAVDTFYGDGFAAMVRNLEFSLAIENRHKARVAKGV